MIEYAKQLWTSYDLGWTHIGLSVLVFIGFSVASLFVVTALLVRLPATYFCESHPRELWTKRHPIVRWSGLLGKNLLGLVLVIIGAVLTMPGIPGPGALTVMIGILLLDFPGKKRVERKLISHPTIFGAINRLRAKHGRDPLVLDPAPCDERRAPEI